MAYYLKTQRAPQNKQCLSAVQKLTNTKFSLTLTTQLKTSVLKILANCIINLKGVIFQFPGKTHYLGFLWCSKLKVAHLVNYFPAFLCKNITISKLFLFTSLVSTIAVVAYYGLIDEYCLHLKLLSFPFLNFLFKS